MDSAIRVVSIRERHMARSGDIRHLDAEATARRIRAMGQEDALIIADCPVRDAAADVVLIRSNELNHIHRSHPELRGREAWLVETVRSPDLVFRDPRYADTYSLAKQITAQHDLFVSVALESTWLRVKSMRIHRQSRTRRLLERSVARYQTAGGMDEE